MPAVVFAQEATTSSDAASQYASFVPLIAIFGVFYFLLIRPQQKKMREHQTMLTALQKGDEVVTGGGIYGTITKADMGDSFTVEIAKGIEVRVIKSTVSAVLGKEVPQQIVTNEKKKSGKAINLKNDNTVPSRSKIANDN